MKRQRKIARGWRRRSRLSCAGPSDGIEALRMWSLKVQVPRAPGGVIGEAVAHGVSHALGFTGATLFLLIALAIGLSLYFNFSWLSVCEKPATPS